MKKINLWCILSVIVASAAVVASLGATAGRAGRPAQSDPPQEQFVAGRNVNMVSGTKLPWGDPWLQRQNEPSLAVSSRNPLHLFAGANDYRTIDMPDDPTQQVPGIPIQIAAARDAWLGVYKSFDGGQSWITTLLPGYPQDVSLEGTTSPIHGYDTACDPCVRSGANGLVFYSGIAFNRSGRAGSVFVARYIDNNNLEKVRRDEQNRPVRDSFEYVDTQVIGVGNPGQFLDMPSIAVDIPRSGSGTTLVKAQKIPNAKAYLAYTIFPGNTGPDVRSKLYFARSTNSGRTWGRPIKVSEDQHVIQRAVIAIDPQDPTGNTVYIAYRRFRDDLEPDAIIVVKSTNGGTTFTKPLVVATIAHPFDQLMNENRFRTNTYPTMAVDHNGVVHIAWSERRNRELGTADPSGQARIVISSASGGLTWTPPQVIDLADGAGFLDGHQIMPSLTYAGGKLMLAWYDQRGTIAKLADPFNSGVTEFIEDKPGLYRQTVDVRAAEGVPGLPPAFFPSQQVSRYLFYLEIGSDGEPVLENGYYKLIQAEHNPINFPLFQLGTRPFIGDYIDLAASPQILPPPVTGGLLWKPNIDGASHPTSFHAAWADNRDVRPPAPDWWGDWVTYSPPNSEQDAPDLGKTAPCQGDTAGKRNQNIYTASLSDGIQVGSPGNTKQLDIPGGSASGRRSFTVFVRNLTEIGPRSFSLSFGSVSGGASASFKQQGHQPTRAITLGPFSSASVTVYVDANWSDPLAPVKVDVKEGGNLVGYVLLNPDKTNLYVVEPEDPLEYLGNEDHTPHVSDPKIWKYDLGSGKDPHPGAENPRVQNPRVQNSGLVNPRVQNAGQENPRVQNKGVANDNIVNSETGNPRVQNPRVQNTALTDMTWTVTNAGNTTSCFSFDVAADSWETLAPYFENGTLKGQLLVYRIHTTPLDAGCALKEEHHDELIVNITNPRVQNPRVQNMTPTATAFAAEGEEDTEPDITERDATFWLAPDEQADVIFRVYDPDITDGVTFEPQAVAAEVAAAAVNTGATAPVIVTQPHVPWIPAQQLPEIGASPISFVLRAASGANPADRALTVSNVGAGTLGYTIADDADWLSVTPAPEQGLGAGATYAHSVSFATSALSPGQYRATITVTDPQAANNPVRIPVAVFVFSSGLPPANEWTARFATTGDTEDIASKVVVDEAGYVYVAGSSGPAGLKDVMVVKYDPYGAKVWEIRHTGFSSPADGNDYAVDMALDAEGSVYVVGASEDAPGGDYDFLTFKYSAAGELRWTARYGFAPGLQDHGRRIVLDSAGNAYVAGWSSGTGTFEDFAIVKYGPTGEQLWAQRYNGTASQPDLVEDIALDEAGDIYATGTSYENGTENDMTTIKFSGATGATLWIRSVATLDSDRGVALAVGPSGSVYATGRSLTPTADYDFVTAKYDPAGALMWARTYNGSGSGYDAPSAIAIDAAENVYVTGQSDSLAGAEQNPDYLTIKYDADGTLLWTALYNGPGNDEDVPLDVAVAPLTGEVVVTGYSDNDPSQTKRDDYATVRYNSAGSPDWVRRYNGPGNGLDSAQAVTIDRVGNIYVTGSSLGDGTGLDFATVKYMPDFEEWSATENGSAGLMDYALDVAADADGNVYVTGASAETGRGTDMATIKYDANGNRLWMSLYNGTAGGDDYGKAIAVDPAGNVYVTGTSVQTGTDTEITIVKYDPDGNLVWQEFYGSPGSLPDAGVAISLDPAGHVLVVGNLNATGGMSGGGSGPIVLLQYDNGGELLWDRVYQDPDLASSSANGMAVSPAGNIFIVGTCYAAATLNDYLTLKYDNSGSLLWDARYNGPANRSEWGQAIAIDGTENVYVTGYGNPLPGVGLRTATVKYDANGAELWSMPDPAGIRSLAIALDPSGNVYITGYNTIKYAGDGAQVWVKGIAGFYGNDLAVDSQGNLYVGGFCEANIGTETECAMVKYDTAGNMLWMAAHHHPGDDNGWSVALDPSDNVYVVTVGYTGETTGDIITIKYKSGRK